MPETAKASSFVDRTEQKRLNEASEAGVPCKKRSPSLNGRLVREQVQGQ